MIVQVMVPRIIYRHSRIQGSSTSEMKQTYSLPEVEMSGLKRRRVIWWPSLMMFGPNDAESKHTAQSMAWKIKRFTNDELRQRFVDITAPQAEFLGLTIPDEHLKYNEETGHYDFGPINWDEFWQVVSGEGPCNRQRLKARRRAHEEGQWVRDAALAHAEKRRQRQAAKNNQKVA